MTALSLEDPDEVYGEEVGDFGEDMHIVQRVHLLDNCPNDIVYRPCPSMTTNLL